LNHAREILIDITEKKKLTQLPLKLQFSLLPQVQRVSQALQSLISGADALQVLEDSVDELTASIWLYNLPNLSGEVLGFTQKMNQLKTQEAAIRQAHREAMAFKASKEKAEGILSRLSETGANVDAISATLTAASSKCESILSEIAKSAESTKATLAELEAGKESAAKSVEACTAASQRSSALVTEAESVRQQAVERLKQVDEAAAAASNQTALAKEETRKAIESLTQSATESRETSKAEVGNATAELRKAIDQHGKAISDLVTNSDARLTQAEKAQKIALDGSLGQFEKLREVKFKELDTEFRRAATEVESRGTASVEKNDAELKRLTTQLEALEGQIRESINRATGYSLFHSFQKRQEDLAKAKKGWAIALGVSVSISLLASGCFIWSLQFVKQYDAAFFLKLSICLPIIYTIAFCNLQYSRERALEEEYAFKSNISISLDPYERLVKRTVDTTKPEELSKYTAFLIASVGQVFTPPAAHKVAESGEKSEDLIEGILKPLGKFLEPFPSLMKK
jgi:chemotaxis protein histidine kinase CheA